MGTLVEDFDCPRGATFLNLSYHSGKKTITNTDPLCLLETDMNFLPSRHRTGSSTNSCGFSNLRAVKGAALVVRTNATVANYDYMFDYAFHIDASP